MTNLRVFGSVARGEDRPDSDVDLLVDLPPHMGLLGLGRVQADLEAILPWASIMDSVSTEQPSDADRLAAAADEVEAGLGPVAVARPGHKSVVLVSADDWQRLEELESAESTAWWRRDAAERAARAEEPGAGEEGPGLDEAGFRRRFSHLLDDAGAA